MLVLSLLPLLALAAPQPRGVPVPAPCLSVPDIAHPPIADAFVGMSAPGVNTGASSFIAAGTSEVRSFVSFPSVAADVAADNRVASLVFPIREAYGRASTRVPVVISVYPIADFTEGNGVFRGPSGDGPGITWACFESSDVSDPDAECNTEWDDGTFDEPTGTGSIVSESQESVSIDVTADARAGVTSWAIAVESGNVRRFGLLFPSRESGDDSILLTVATTTVCVQPLPDLTTRTVASANGAVLAIGDGVHPDRLFVVFQSGTIRIFSLMTGTYDTGDFLSVANIISSGGERGLLSLAFHPDFANTETFFIYYTDLSGAVTLARMRTWENNSDVADPDSLEVLIVVNQPFSNHNGGHIQFGIDGYLYTAFGDGGSANDPGCRSQRPDELYGKMIRIDVDSPIPEGSDLPYVVPADNPEADAEWPRNIIWATGLRNPWRWDFDADGGLYIADVGQSVWEEINYVPAGTAAVNYGWNTYEGNACFGPRDEGACVAEAPECGDDGLTFPVFEYRHGFRCSVTGGFVYEGADIPAAQGGYFFADYCSGDVWFLRNVNGVWEEEIVFTVGGFFGDVRGFGQDMNGEVYILNGGQIRKIVEA